MKKKKQLPVILMIVIDLLLCGAVMVTFAYFHHVRSGASGQEIDVLEDFGDQGGSTEDGESSGIHEHSWTIKETVEPTCTDGGYTLYGCSCGEEKRDDFTEPLAHSKTHLENQKEASFDAPGYSGDEYCDYCGVLLKAGTEIPAKKHVDLQLINEKQATCTEEGYSGDWFCNDEECKKIVAEGTVTPKLDHTYTVSKVVKPTCQSEGYTLSVCSVCGAEKIDQRTAKTDHAFGENGKCKYCGAERVDTSGDFGKTLGDKFLPTAGTPVKLTSDKEIRAYAKKNELPIRETTGSTYLCLYRSHDIYMTVRKVDETVTYKGVQRRLVYYDYDVYVRNLRNIFTLTSMPTSYSAPMEELISRASDYCGGSVFAAINGDYYGNERFCVAAVRNGKLLRKVDSITHDVCVLYYDGTMATYSKGTYNYETISAGRPYQMWHFGPSLLDESGSPISESAFDKEAFDDNVIGRQHPRAAIGYYEPGHYALVCADGRNRTTSGMYLEQLGTIMSDMGCKVAYNLDGGDSAQAYLNGDLIRVGSKQRRLCDVICVGEWE